MAKPALEFHEPPGTWRPTGVPDQWEKILAEDPDDGTCTRLLRFGPGCDTATAGTLKHEFWEEIYVLSGELTDTRLSSTFSEGYYACRPPGMEHGPWRSPGGAVLFEVRYRRP